MSAVYQELLDNGAPDLPEGYFYRIEMLWLFEIPRIQIRKRHRFWPSTEVWTGVFDWDFNTPYDYARACGVAYKKAGFDQVSQDRAALFNRMRGDHP